MSKENREYRSMAALNVRDIEGEEGGKMIVEGYATTFNDPYILYADDEIEIREEISPDAFNNADMSDVIMQYDHAGRVFARIRNNTLTITPDETGLFVSADLGGTDIGRGLYQEIAGGYTDKMSFGFTVAEDEREIVSNNTDDKTKMIRRITKIGKLFDVSAVSLPQNPGTSISARFLDGAIEEARSERIKALELIEKRERLSVRIRALKGEKAE